MHKWEYTCIHLFIIKRTLIVGYHAYFYEKYTLGGGYCCPPKYIIETKNIGTLYKKTQTLRCLRNPSPIHTPVPILTI